MPIGRTAGPAHFSSMLALFRVFALHHSVLARSGAKRWLTRHVPPPLERSLYVWVASLLFIAVCALWQDVPGGSIAMRVFRALPHWTAVSAGVWLTARSAAVIDPLELAGIRHAGRSAGASALSGGRAVPLGAAPDLSRLGC